MLQLSVNATDNLSRSLKLKDGNLLVFCSRFHGHTGNFSCIGLIFCHQVNFWTLHGMHEKFECPSILKCIKLKTTAQHGDSEALLSGLTAAGMTTVSNIVRLSSGVPFKLDLNGNVVSNHVFGRVRWGQLGISLQGSFTCPSLSCSPALTLEPKHAVIEKSMNG